MTENYKEYLKISKTADKQKLQKLLQEKQLRKQSNS